MFPGEAPCLQNKDVHLRISPHAFASSKCLTYSLAPNPKKKKICIFNLIKMPFIYFLIKFSLNQKIKCKISYTLSHDYFHSNCTYFSFIFQLSFRFFVILLIIHYAVCCLCMGLSTISIYT